MCWCLILEEFGPELKYIKGENNVVTDALSILDISDNKDILNISELYGYDDDDLPDSAYPICYHDIAKAQKTDAKLKQKLVSHKDYTHERCRGYSLYVRLAFVVVYHQFSVLWQYCDNELNKRTWDGLRSEERRGSDEPTNLTIWFITSLVTELCLY